MDHDLKQAVLEYMHERAVAPLPEDEEAALDTHYLDDGLLDSLGLVELVTTMEDRFDFRLEPEDMQAPEFRTVRGLIETASRRRAGVP